MAERTFFCGRRGFNRINLTRTLWSIAVQDFDTTKVGNLLIVTECEYFAQDGCKTIETTWHHVTAWESEDVKNLEQLSGQVIEVKSMFQGLKLDKKIRVLKSFPIFV